MVADQQPSPNSPSRLIHGVLTERIIGVFYDVYNELGFGYLEAVYRRAMEVALEDAGLSVAREVPCEVVFRGRVIGVYKADLVVEDAVVLELKTARAIDPNHEAQLLNYLRGTSLELGVLFNFGHHPQFRRMILSNHVKANRTERRP